MHIADGSATICVYLLLVGTKATATTGIIRGQRSEELTCDNWRNGGASVCGGLARVQSIARRLSLD